MRARWLILVSVLAGAVYLATGGAVIKGFAVGALAVLAFLARRKRRDAAVLSLALALCTAGDVLLDLDPRFFPMGLGAFLIAHIVYSAVFVRNRTAPAGRPRIAAVVVVAAFSISLSAWIVPAVGALAVPVVLYIVALTTMVSTAILAHFRQRWVAIGAILFLVSDSLLAVHKFKEPVPLRDILVWTTYYLGQCGIAFGYLASADRQ